MNPRSQAIALEQNAEGTRLLIVTRDGRIRGAAFERHATISPRPGWLEADPAELWYKAKKVIASGLDIHRTFPEEIACLGVTGEPASIVWNPLNGEPYYNAIWATDSRAASDATPLDSNSAARHLLWLLENVPGLREFAERGEALFGPIESWLIWNLTGVHAIDCTGAAQTGLLDLETGHWVRTEVEALGIPRAILPSIHPSADATGFGQTKAGGRFGAELPIDAAMSLPLATMLGLSATRVGESVYLPVPRGRLLVCTGENLVPGREGIIEFEQVGRAPLYAFEANLPRTPEDPAAQSKGIAAAIAEMELMAGIEMRSLLVDTARGDDALLRALTDGLRIPVSRPVEIENASLGAAFAAGLAAGFWQSLDEVRELVKLERALPSARD